MGTNRKVDISPGTTCSGSSTPTAVALAYGLDKGATEQTIWSSTSAAGFRDLAHFLGASIIHHVPSLGPTCLT